MSLPDISCGKGPDRWPRRWQEKMQALRKVDWSTFRRDKVLMYGIQTQHSRINQWLEKCRRLGVPEHVMVDDPFGSPIGRELDFGFVTASSLKYAYYAMQIWNRLRSAYAPFVLEIGGGYGGLARAMHLLFGLNAVTFLDAEPCLEIQTRYLKETCPQVWCQPYQEEQTYDLVVNTMSLGEMPLSEVERYFQIIQARLVDGGAFYTANRVHRVTNFSQYPYDRKWRHEVWDTYDPAKPRTQYFECFSVRDLSADSDHPSKLLV